MLSFCQLWGKKAMIKGSTRSTETKTLIEAAL
jgi:hypothetical protein